MNKFLSEATIQVKDIKLWAHVGVLEKERLYGQYFLLDFHLYVNSEKVVRSDQIKDTSDYSLAITLIKKLSLKIRCNTLEFFSEEILNKLVEIYGDIPIYISLRKCKAPILGFDGIVGVERFRNWPDYEKQCKVNSDH